MTDDYPDRSAEELERDRRQQIVDEARATVERLELEEAQRDEVASLPPQKLARRLIGSPLDRNERWRIEGENFAKECEKAKAELAAPSKPAAFDWSVLDSRIESLIVRDREIAIEAVAEQTVALIAKARRDAQRALHEEVVGLKLEVATLKVEIAGPAAPADWSGAGRFGEGFKKSDRGNQPDFSIASASFTAILLHSQKPFTPTWIRRSAIPPITGAPTAATAAGIRLATETATVAARPTERWAVVGVVRSTPAFFACSIASFNAFDATGFPQMRSRNACNMNLAKPDSY
jgi:hypothetical protein